jgi:hypothetical protein
MKRIAAQVRSALAARLVIGPDSGMGGTGGTAYAPDGDRTPWRAPQPC